MTGLTFDLKRGQTLGVIGGTGSGKSTLVQLLAHLYPVAAGQLTIFPKDAVLKISENGGLGLVWCLRRRSFFKGTVRSNLTLGMSTKPTDADLWQALEIAQAADFVSQKEGGLDATVEAFWSEFFWRSASAFNHCQSCLAEGAFLGFR